MKLLKLVNPDLSDRQHDEREAAKHSLAKRVILDILRKGPRRTAEPHALGHCAKAADEDADDMDVDLDSDDDLASLGANESEREDLKARRKSRKAADKKKQDQHNSNLAAAKKVLTKIHAGRPQPEDPDFLLKSCSPAELVQYESRHPSVVLTKAAQARNVPIDEAQIQRIIAQGNGSLLSKAARGRIIDEVVRENPQANTTAKLRALTQAAFRKASKPNFPPNSSNQSLTNAPLADTGNTNSFVSNRPVPSQRINETLGGYTDSRIGPNDSRIRAAVMASGTEDPIVTAIKNDWANRKQQMGVSFANRPAAQGSSNGDG